MSKIRIKNFGPIKEGYQENDGWLDVKKVTAFIGNQGSGKSSIAKLISTFAWIEKALTRGDYNSKDLGKPFVFKDQFLTYHRIENYSSDNTVVEYKGSSYCFIYENGVVRVEDARNGDYPLPQIMYVPAERNFISNVRNSKVLNLTSPSLSEFLTEFNNATESMKGPKKLPINEVEVEYFEPGDVVRIKGNDYWLDLAEASSGFQSFVPLYLVSSYLSHSVKKESDGSRELMSHEQRERFRKLVEGILTTPGLTDEQKRIVISGEAKKFNKTAFINIVEEPEQNLFPTSQWKMLTSLLEFNNRNTGNKLIMTTHSPYIVGYLSIAIQGSHLLNKIQSTENKLSLVEKLSSVVPVNSVINSEEVAIYQLDETRGTIAALPNPTGIPSDKNYLNNLLAEGDRLFDRLLEIEQEL